MYQNIDSIIKRLKECVVNSGLSFFELEQLTGIPKSTIQRYTSGKTKKIPVDSIQKLAKALGVSSAYIMGWNHAATDDSLNGFSKAFKIPVLGYVKAGIPIEAVEEVLDYEEISTAMASQGEFFALSIKGDSMEPKISNGDVVIVRKQEFVENGELAVVLINGNDATVKKFYKTESGIKLISTNPAYDPFFYSAEEVETLPVRIIGKVVELRAKF